MDDLTTNSYPSIPILSHQIFPYDLASLSIECSAFLALLFSVLLMHILFNVYPPSERHNIALHSYLPPAKPTNFEAFLFLAIAWTAFLPVSLFLTWMIDLGISTWCKILITDPEASLDLYSAYLAERWTLCELINHRTFQLQETRAVFGAVACEVLSTWLMFQIVIGLEGIVEIWYDVKEGKETVDGLMHGYRRRFKEYVRRVGRANESRGARRRSEEFWISDLKIPCYV